MTGYDVHTDKALKELRARLTEAERERDEANERHAALAEHVVACLPYEAETDGEALDAWECVDAASREIARLQRERDEARASAIRVGEECDAALRSLRRTQTALDEERRVCTKALAERDEARAALLAPLRYEANPEAGDGQHVCEGCGEERDEPHTWRACAERLAGLQVEGIDALVEQARREQAEIERDEARAALASEPARIAAAEMARDVAWVRAACCAAPGPRSFLRTGLVTTKTDDIIEAVCSGATDADIAAAIRAARGAR